MSKIGIGTHTYRDQDFVSDLFKELEKFNYDFVDCAWRHGNEAIIGSGIRVLKQNLGDDYDCTLPFQSKAWPTQYSQGIPKTIKFSIGKIGISTIIDGYMLHRPHPDMEVNLLAWRQLIDCRKCKLVRKIGLGNFDKDMIEKLYEKTGVRPDFLQVELSLNNMRWDRIVYCQERGIEIQAYEPFGDLAANAQNPDLIKLTEKYKITIRVLLISFLLNVGVVPIVVPEKIEDVAEFIKAKDVVLEKEDIEFLKTLNSYKNMHQETFAIDFKEGWS
ncbi:aldo/keto reductase family oxidoreductase [Mycoplasma haemocanis str. Illinois]|uniref:Aldo/keto reductase family oxidoreductase n=1 Tax=Mycoplasma haemocanis (strain Illinois) TaxID=1111676 RepID=H6N7U1_MYCHN|nr:aldo/keto reductase [Mycoplasma haemocanis]AEW45713.1 aldo/keto reductase family oxidoreductase [Mycoplasma haemocanis str. Illinois]